VAGERWHFGRIASLSFSSRCGRASVTDAYSGAGAYLILSEVGSACLATSLTQMTANSTIPVHVYEVRPRKDKRGVDLISDTLPFGKGVRPPGRTPSDSLLTYIPGARRSSEPQRNQGPIASTNPSATRARSHRRALEKSLLYGLLRTTCGAGLLTSSCALTLWICAACSLSWAVRTSIPFAC
jgi:hypothetical protein